MTKLRKVQFVTLILIGCASIVIPILALNRDAYASELNEVIACAQAKDSIQCATPHIQNMMRIHNNARAVMDDITAHVDAPACHYFGHIVGLEVYSATPDVEQAIDQCSRSCNAACVHGVIGEAFARELGYSEGDFDLAHIPPSDMRALGKRLCTSAQACHGVGHVLFQFFQDLDKAMGECEQMIQGSYRDFCYNGVAMEYADLLSNRSVRPPNSVTFPSISELSEVCLFENDSQSRNCFSYFPRMVISTLGVKGIPSEEIFERINHICMSYPSEQDRLSCVGGIGTHHSSMVLRDIPGILEECGRFSGVEYRACMIGVVSKAADDRKAKLIEYCGQQPDEATKNLCYQGMFFSIRRSGIRLKSVDEMCGTDNQACRVGYDRSEKSAWKSIHD